MADKKLTELISEIAPVGADSTYIVKASDNSSKKATLTNLFASAPALVALQTGINAHELDLNAHTSLTTLKIGADLEIGAGILASANSIIGKDAGELLTTGVSNTVFGYDSFVHAVNASYNVVIGYHALHVAVDANSNVAIGNNTLAANVSSGGNIAIGVNALSALTTGINNTAIGSNAAMNSTTGDINTVLGEGALEHNIIGYHNTIIGANAGHNSLGNCNLMVGTSAGLAVTSGEVMTLVGTAAGISLTTGSGNTVVGYEGLHECIAGSKNVVLGYNAGWYETGSNKLFIDNDKRFDEAGARLFSLIYGVFDAVVANQRLYINAGQVAIEGQLTIANSNYYRSKSVAGNSIPNIGLGPADELYIGSGSVIVGITFSTGGGGGPLRHSNGLTTTPNLQTTGTLLGFYGHATTAQQVLATGGGATVDNVITALQTLGLVKQA